MATGYLVRCEDSGFTVQGGGETSPVGSALDAWDWLVARGVADETALRMVADAEDDYGLRTYGYVESYPDDYPR